MNKKYKKITARTLEHVLLWGKQLCEKKSWTKSDSNTYDLIKKEAKRIRNEDYLKRRAIKANPYLEKKTPYRAT